MNNIHEISHRLKELRLKNGLEQTDVAECLGYKSFTTISKWENGKNLPSGGKLAKLALLFNTTTDYILHGEEVASVTPNTPSALQNTTEKITSKVTYLDKELKDPRHGQWVSHGERLLEEQQEEQKRAEELRRQETNKPKNGIVTELFEECRKKPLESEEKSLHAITGITATAAASGLGRGYGYDDNDTYTVYTDERPPKTYTFATMVKGDSMMPEYKEGDMLYLHDKGISSYSGMLAVVAYGDRTYFKKIYTEDEHLRLVSLNEKYEDILLDFPPSEDTHIRIFEVVGSFTPIEM